MAKIPFLRKKTNYICNYALTNMELIGADCHKKDALWTTKNYKRQ